MIINSDVQYQVKNLSLVKLFTTSNITPQYNPSPTTTREESHPISQLNKGYIDQVSGKSLAATRSFPHCPT